MSFFKGFKDDMSQAVNELMPDSNEMFDDDEAFDELLGTRSEKKTKEKKKRKEKRDTKGRHPAKTNVGDDLDLAPEDMSGHIDDLLDNELYSNTEEAGMLLDDDMEVNTMDMSVGDLLTQLSEQKDSDQKHKKRSKKTGKNQSSASKAEDEPEKAREAGSDIGLDALLDSIADRVDRGELNPMGEDMSDEASVKEDDLSESLGEEESAVETARENPDNGEDNSGETSDTENIENLEEAMMEEEKDIMEVDPEEESVEESQGSAAENSSYHENTDRNTTHITQETNIKGDITTEGSMEIMGNIEGNIACKGKVVVGGSVTGNIESGELYANNARIQGDILSEGSVKIGVGSTIIGGIIGASAVIAGAVNGDIDVQGPVIIDSTAVIMGNIKSRSVQINNGAVIEGFCSQSYSDIDVKNFFA